LPREANQSKRAFAPFGDSKWIPNIQAIAHVHCRNLLELANSLEFCNFMVSTDGSAESEAALGTLLGRLNADEHALLGADAAQQLANFGGITLLIIALHRDPGHSWWTRDQGCRLKQRSIASPVAPCALMKGDMFGHLGLWAG